MALALSELIVPLTADECESLQLDVLKLAGFPVTSWQSGSVPLTLVKADAATLADASKTVATVAKGGFLELAETDDWIDLDAENHYDITRKSAVVCQGVMTLTDNGGGPYTIVPGQLYAGPPSGTYRYVNTTGGTLALNGTLSLSWQAESPGAAYNLANGSITSLMTPLPGVSVANPDPGTGTWVTQFGTNAESNESLIKRCKARWPGLGGGANAPVYESWAITAADTVTRVNVLENYPTGGQVTIYCGGASGASSPSDVATVDAYIQVRRPLCVTVNVSAASNRVITLAGTVYVQAAYRYSAEGEFVDALTAYAASLPVGAPVYLSKIVDLIQTCTGVRNVNLSLPSADTTLAANEIATFTTSLTWTPI